MPNLNKISSHGQSIPNWMIWVQAICFAVLYAIWALPGTILIRHICLILGAFIGLYEIYKYRNLFLQITARVAPVWLLVGLFVWATIHLIFLSNDYSAQYLEYTTIWKRTAIGAIFAFGFGLALGANFLDKKEEEKIWAIFYLGIFAPSLIYIAKYILTHYGLELGWEVPPFWRLYRSSAPFYLPKTAYVCFCFPALALAIGLLIRNLEKHKWIIWGNLIYCLTILTIFFIFYNENIKNGVVYGVILILAFLFLYLRSSNAQWLIKITVATLIISITSFYLVDHFQTNKTWFSFISDARFALQLDKYNNWQFNATKGFPEDEFGRVISGTNYERIAWGKAGLILLAENPVGYGLIERSFGHLAGVKWPESTLHQSHSGWLDLALGVGVPGVLLILGSMFFSLRSLFLICKNNAQNEGGYPSSRWLRMVWWVLLASLLMWSTTEISQKVFFDSLIFWVALSSAFSLSLTNKLDLR